MGLRPVYPRVGGGTGNRTFAKSAASGLSPRGRGNRTSTYPCKRWRGSIPAWAGEPYLDLHLYQGSRVYPRVGGGTRFIIYCAWIPVGLSPRGRGTSHRLGIIKVMWGLSPRGRGNPLHESRCRDSIGSIPAWAGEPLPRYPIDGVNKVYPRVGGGTHGGGGGGISSAGLSPRGRGNRDTAPRDDHLERSIPAWAGEPGHDRHSHDARKVYPRVGGGTLPQLLVAATLTGLSPRGRGNRASMLQWATFWRSIPAWAGEPQQRYRDWNRRTVYPRVGGGTSFRAAATRTANGLSPRGRGNRGGLSGVVNLAGSIPAWAGEPTPYGRSSPLSTVYPRVGGGTP